MDLVAEDRLWECWGCDGPVEAPLEVEVGVGATTVSASDGEMVGATVDAIDIVRWLSWPVEEAILAVLV